MLYKETKVYCRNTPCDYEGFRFDDGTRDYDKSIATCPKCGFKTLYHIQVKMFDNLAKFYEESPDALPKM